MKIKTKKNYSRKTKKLMRGGYEDYSSVKMSVNSPPKKKSYFSKKIEKIKRIWKRPKNKAIKQERVHLAQEIKIGKVLLNPSLSNLPPDEVRKMTVKNIVKLIKSHTKKQEQIAPTL